MHSSCKLGAFFNKARFIYDGADKEVKLSFVAVNKDVTRRFVSFRSFAPMQIIYESRLAARILPISESMSISNS